MYDLPFDLRFELGGRRVRLVHGVPRKVNVAALADADVLLFGHTHKPWVHEYGGVLFVNCGAVGKPKDGDPRARFAVLSGSGTGVDVAIERVAYDAAAVAAEVPEVGLPGEFADNLVAGPLAAARLRRGLEAALARTPCPRAAEPTSAASAGRWRVRPPDDEHRGTSHCRRLRHHRRAAAPRQALTVSSRSPGRTGSPGHIHRRFA